MTDADFDASLIAAAFRLAAQDGWARVSVAAACREAGLPLAEARARFPSRGSILLGFGRMADQFALTDASADGPVRDRLFELLMRRYDALNAHRDGVTALLRTLPFDPPTALLLACATRASMRWLLQAAGAGGTGLRGELRTKGLVAVWLWGLRAWERDDTEDLSQTMAAVDNALGRAEQFANMLGRRGGESSSPAVADGEGEPESPPDLEQMPEPPPEPPLDPPGRTDPQG
jgi:ubiquinone biosynthesis protein COQ9